jgi:hypothetical protein
MEESDSGDNVVTKQIAPPADVDADDADDELRRAQVGRMRDKCRLMIN